MAQPANAEVSAPGNSTVYSSRSVRRHEGSRPTTGVPRSTYGRSVSSTRRASVLASSTRPVLRNVRPQHSGRRPSTGLGKTTLYPAASSTLRAARAFSGSKYLLNVSTSSTTSGR